MQRLFIEQIWRFSKQISEKQCGTRRRGVDLSLMRPVISRVLEVNFVICYIVRW